MLLFLALSHCTDAGRLTLGTLSLVSKSSRLPPHLYPVTSTLPHHTEDSLLTMVFSDDLSSYSPSSLDEQTSPKEDTGSETDSGSIRSTSLQSPSPSSQHGDHEAPHSHVTDREQCHYVMGSDADTVIVVSKDKHSGKREHIMLRSLLKTRGSPGRIEKRVIIRR